MNISININMKECKKNKMNTMKINLRRSMNKNKKTNKKKIRKKKIIKIFQDRIKKKMKQSNSQNRKRKK